MNKQGILYIVATPLGNLGDITSRAIDVLNQVDIIAAEDTRHSQHLLTHLGIAKKHLLSIHDHNEREQTGVLLAGIVKGENVALISDAGTPLISDPGYVLVRTAHEMGIQVVPIPGACALIAALSVSGLPTDRFCFEGFLPAKVHAREAVLQSLSTETRTMVFYEAPHRILETLRSLHSILGPDREATLARELTKTFETIKQGTVSALLKWVEEDINQTRGEMVLILKGAVAAKKEGLTPDAIQILSILMADLSLKQAVDLTAKITGIRKREIYTFALTLNDENND